MREGNTCEWQGHISNYMHFQRMKLIILVEWWRLSKGITTLTHGRIRILHDEILKGVTNKQTPFKSFKVTCR